MGEKVNQADFPRITLRCNKCSNEFQLNVLRFREGSAVVCQVCGNEFPAEIGHKFAQALQQLFEVKYELDKRTKAFQFSFIYKSNDHMPPVPHSFNHV